VVALEAGKPLHSHRHAFPVSMRRRRAPVDHRDHDASLARTGRGLPGTREMDAVRLAGQSSSRFHGGSAPRRVHVIAAALAA
jgi:hypothetical protein